MVPSRIVRPKLYCRTWVPRARDPGPGPVDRTGDSRTRTGLRTRARQIWLIWAAPLSWAG